MVIPLHDVVQTPRHLPLVALLFQYVQVGPPPRPHSGRGNGSEGACVFSVGNITSTSSSVSVSAAFSVSVPEFTSTYESMLVSIDPPIAQYPNHQF